MHKTVYKKSLVFRLLLATTLLAVCGATFVGWAPARAATGTNEQVNYQGRLLTGTGAVVPDGTYNMEFKIVQDGDGCNPTSGTPPCGGTLKWTETRTGTNKVTVKNGYFSAYLGSVTPFSSNVDWNQDTLWLTVNIGGTGTPSWDGEMEPFNRLSSTPYALNSKSLGGLLASNFVQLAQGSQTDSSILSSIYINKTGASGNILELEKNGTDVLVVGNNGALTVTGTTSINATGTAASSIGNSTGALTLASGGTSSWNNTAGTLTIQTVTSGNLVLDSVAALNLGTTSSTSTSLGKTGTTLTINPTAWTATPTISGLITATSGLTSNGTATFNTDTNFIFAGTENVDIDSDLAGALNIVDITATPSSTVGATAGLYVEQANSANTNGLDDGIVIQNQDTDLAISNGLIFRNNGGGGYTNFIATGSGTFTVTGAGVLTAANFSGSSSGTNTGDQTTVTGNAGTATALQTARNINGVSFNGTADITLTAAAGTLTGATLNSGVTASSLTSVGTLTGLTVTGTANISTSGSAITTIGAMTTTDLVLQDAQWNITGAGAATFASVSAGSGLITTSGTIGTAATTAFTGLTGVFSTSVTTPLVDTSGTLSLGTGSSTATSLGKTGTTLTINPTAWTATPTISGLITATSGLTSTGTLTANGAVTLGDGGDDISINSNDWDISGAGVGSGFTGFASTGTIAFSGAGAFSVDSSAFDVTSGGAVSGVTTLAASGLISANGGLTLASAQALSFAGTTVASNTIKFADSAGSTVSGINFVNSTDGTNFLSIRDLTAGVNNRFGGLVIADAFASKQSYFAEEFNVDKANDCVANTFTVNTTSNKSRGNQATGGNFGAACTTSGGDQLTTELSTSSVATASSASNTCTYRTPATNTNGLEEIVAASTTGAPNVDCLEYIGTSVNSSGNNIFNSSYLPQVQTKIRTGARTATQPLYVGLSDMVAALVGPTAGNKGAYFTNCSTPIAAGTCSATSWYGVVQDGTIATVTAACPVSPTTSTTNFAYLRIETRPDTAGTGVITEFFIDSDVSDGIAEQSCGTVTSATGSGYLSSALNMLYMATIKGTSSVTSTFGMDYFRVWQDDAPGIPVDEVVSGTPEGETDLKQEMPLDTPSFNDVDVLNGLMAQTDPELAQVAASQNRMDIDYLVATGGVVTPTLTASKVKTNEITSATGKDININIGEDGNLLVKGANNETVFSIDANGNAVLGGSLITENNSAEPTGDQPASDAAVFQTATIELDMTVNGSLLVGNALQVSGPATFNGESLFDSLVRFSDVVDFNGEVNFNGRVSFNNNNGGFANLKAGETEVKVAFTTPYSDVPIVTVNPRDGQFLAYAYKDLTKDGFTIVLKDPAGQPASFAWTALVIKDPKTAEAP